MKRIVIGIAGACVMGAASAGGHVEWGYDGEHGPAHWGSLSDQFIACSTGKNQSPIDLQGFVEAELPALELTYTTQAKEILNNGHSVQINYTAGSTLNVDGISFELKQFHFHTPSENLIEGKSFPLEAHLVHAAADGSLAVISVMFEEGDANPLLADLWTQMPKNAGDKHPIQGGDVHALLPKNMDYYRFNGSLTTPPCSEGVRWLVLKQPMTVSAQQVKLFADTMHHANNRPVQAVNARPVLQ